MVSRELLLKKVHHQHLQAEFVEVAEGATTKQVLYNVIESIGGLVGDVLFCSHQKLFIN